MFNETSPVEATQQLEANKMIRQGATLGMVVNVLRSQGLSDEQCSSVIQKAIKKEVNRKRLIAGGWTLLGITLIVLGIVMNMLVAANQHFAKLPIVVGVAGLILIVYGIVSFFQAD